MTAIEIVNDVTVEVVQLSASDASVIAAARVSTQGHGSLEALGTDPAEAEGLIRFLMRNRHGTPFEHNLFGFFVDAPIKVWREHHRHRIGVSVNETSGRYREMEPRFYVAPRHRRLVQVGKPGDYRFEPASDGQYQRHVARKTRNAERAWESYQEDLADGIALEAARDDLPVNLMSQCWITMNARSLMSFLSLRTEHDSPVSWHPDRTGRSSELTDTEVPVMTYPIKKGWAWNRSTPMQEIAMVAEKYEAVFAEAMPITYKAFCDYGRVAP